MWRLLLLAGWAAAQSNYADHANSIEYPNEGLPDSTVLDGKVTKLDDLAPVIFLNRTKAALNCAAGYMQVTSYCTSDQFSCFYFVRFFYRKKYS